MMVAANGQGQALAAVYAVWAEHCARIGVAWGLGLGVVCLLQAADASLLLPPHRLVSCTPPTNSPLLLYILPRPLGSSPVALCQSEP